MVKENLSWTKQFVNMSAAQRTAIKNKVLDQLKTELGKTRANPRRKRNPGYGTRLYDLLNSNDVEFIGVVPNTRYFKCKGTNEELDALWIHPHGGPALLFGHKDGGCLFTVSPLLRVNDSLINEIAGNPKKDMIGISG